MTGCGVVYSEFPCLGTWCLISWSSIFLLTQNQRKEIRVPEEFQELIQGQINAKLAEGKNVLDSIICKQNKKFHNINPSWQVSTGENVLDSIIYKQNEKFHNINPSWE